METEKKKVICPVWKSDLCMACPRHVPSFDNSPSPECMSTFMILEEGVAELLDNMKKRGYEKRLGKL